MVFKAMRQATEEVPAIPNPVIKRQVPRKAMMGKHCAAEEDTASLVAATDPKTIPTPQTCFPPTLSALYPNLSWPIMLLRCVTSLCVRYKMIVAKLYYCIQLRLAAAQERRHAIQVNHLNVASIYL